MSFLDLAEIPGNTSPKPTVLSLPREIRDEIFAHALIDSDALLLTCYKGCAHATRHSHTAGVQRTFSALRLTSRLLKAEAEEMFFQKNTFYISPVQTQGDSLMFEYVSHCACDFILRHVRRLGMVFVYARNSFVVELRLRRGVGWSQEWFPQEGGLYARDALCWKGRTASRVAEFVEGVLVRRRGGEGIDYEDVRKIGVEVGMVAREEIALGVV